MEIRNGMDYLPEVRKLIIQYTTQLNRDLSFQNLDSELEDLSNKYLPPNGELLVVMDDNDVLGMVAYAKHDDSTCEMKRLYVKPEVRGLHLGDFAC